MRSAITTLFISLAIAFLPIYKRVAVLDFNRTSKDNLLMILFGLFGVLFKDTRRSFPLSGWIILAFALFLNIYNQHNVVSINVMFHSFYIASAMFFFVRFYECFDTRFEELILNGMCLGAIIQSLFIIFNAFGINLDLIMMSVFNEGLVVKGDAPAIRDVAGTLGNSNLLAGYMSLCCLAFFRKNWIYLLPIPLICLLLSYSFMGIGSFISGAVFYLLLKYINPIWFYLLSASSMVLVYFTGLNNMDSGRFEIWGNLISRYDLQAIIGYGPGWFADQKIQWRDTMLVQEHSSLLTTVSVFGLIGLVVLLYVFYKASQTKNKIFSAILFAIFLNSYGHFSFHQSTMVIIILCTVAICLIKEENNEYLERS